ncbi:MAG: hypothetical protein IPL53_03970 [Ignavibacteria bacterium]|nr:hypothetical protein [Ignavibacteria bacterium]
MQKKKYLKVKSDINVLDIVKGSMNATLKADNGNPQFTGEAEGSISAPSEFSQLLDWLDIDSDPGRSKYEI